MKPLFTFATVLTFAVAANAASVTYTTSTSPAVVPNPSVETLTDFVGTIDVPQFSPSLGTLDSVTLQIFATFTTDLFVDNDSPSGSSGTVRTEVDVTYSISGLLADTTFSFQNAPPLNYNLAAGEDAQFLDVIANGDDLAYLNETAGAVLTAFTGNGVVVIDTETLTETLLANTGGNTAADQDTEALITAEVTYNFTEGTTIPTPAAAGSMLAIAGLGLFRRRR